MTPNIDNLVALQALAQGTAQTFAGMESFGAIGAIVIVACEGELHVVGAAMPESLAPMIPGLLEAVRLQAITRMRQDGKLPPLEPNA